MAVENISDQVATQVVGDLFSGIEPLIEILQPLFVKLSLLVGGIFGVYLLLLFARVYYERKKVRILQDIRYDLDQLNIHYDIGYSRTRKTLFRKMYEHIKSLFVKEDGKKNVKKNSKKKRNK